MTWNAYEGAIQKAREGAAEKEKGIREKGQGVWKGGGGAGAGVGVEVGGGVYTLSCMAEVV